MKVEKGSSRIVFVFKSCVVKIPNIKEYRLFISGILANLQENKFSGHHPDLAKVLYCDNFGLFLTMERAKVISNNIDWQKFEQLLERKYLNDDLKEFLLSDTKPSNWGIIKKRLVKIDYGN